MVSKLNSDRKAGEGAGQAIGRIYGKIGFGGLWNGLPVRIFMIGTLTAFQWLIYDSFKVYLGVSCPTRKSLWFKLTIPTAPYDWRSLRIYGMRLRRYHDCMKLMTQGGVVTVNRRAAVRGIEELGDMLKSVAKHCLQGKSRRVEMEFWHDHPKACASCAYLVSSLMLYTDPNMA